MKVKNHDIDKDEMIHNTMFTNWLNYFLYN